MAAAEVGELDGMVWVAEENLIFLADYNQDHFLGVEVFGSHALYVLFADGPNPRAKLFPKLRVFGSASGKFVLGESHGHLRLGRKGAREAVNEPSFRGIQFRITDRLGGYLLHFLKDESNSIMHGSRLRMEPGCESQRIINATLKDRVGVVGQSLVRTDAVDDAGREAAAAKNVIHHQNGVIVRVVARDARQHHGHAPLGDILVHQIEARRAEYCVGGYWRRLLTREWPVAKKLFQLLHPLVAVGIATDSHNEVGRTKPVLMKLLNIPSGDRIHRRSRGMTVDPEILSEGQKVIFSALDAAR